jgi:hypothetical protein
MDTRDTRVQNLLFLLSAAPLGLGCVIGGDGETDTEAATEAPTTETPGTTESPGTTETPGDTTETPSDTTETPSDTTETPSDTTVTPDDTTTGGATVPEACVPYADLFTMCYDEKMGAAQAANCAELFANYEMYYTAECVTAYEEWLACISALTCDVLTGEDAFCEETDAAISAACVAK